MGHLNIEIKARCKNQDCIHSVLKAHHAEFKGLDHQIDTYFETKSGRLKLREGNIENALVYYEREDKEGPKKSDIVLYQTGQSSGSLKDILTKTLGIKVVVEKRREIYFIDNVKFHLDLVEDLGTFVEIEAIDVTGVIGKEKLHEQCREFCTLFNIAKEDYISCSYSDLLLQKKP